MGFDEPTPVQISCIPEVLHGNDILASAQTGTGKTAAFVLPVLQKLLDKKKEGELGIRVLVITPTRELAGQVDEAFFALGYHTGLTTAKVYGGDDWSRQEKALKRGTNIIVATPGRLLDHMKMHKVDFSNLDFLILDEADRMLDMGFIPDIQQIVGKLPKNRQTLMFSATLPDKIIQLAQSLMKNPRRINMAPDNKAAEGVRQGMYYIEERDKLSLVLHLYEKEKWTSAIIFMSTKRAVDKLTRELSRKGANVTSIHGDRSQSDREKALESFRKGEYRIIVATDVMSRGIDVVGVSHVINFSVPHDVEDYVHRIGRTARAEKTGDAITLVSGQDRRYMENILRTMKSVIVKQEVPDLGGLSDTGKKTQAGRKPGASGPGRTPRKKSTADRAGRSTGARQKKEQPAGRGQGRKRPEAEASMTPAQVESKEEAGSTAEKEKSTAEKKSPQSRRKTPDKSDDRNLKKTRTKAEARDASDGSDRPKPKSEGDSSDKAGARGKAGTSDKTSARGKAGTSGKASTSEKAGVRGKTSGRGKAGASGKTSARGKTASRSRTDTASKEKTGPKSRDRLSKKDLERKELFENITSPDMERVNKSVENKKGIWHRIKGMLGSE